ncbi:MAG: hypothetical protein AAGC55_02740 [Myxococcota bacterium]
MIARIKAAPGLPEEGYIALCSRGPAEWAPIDNQIYHSLDVVLALCRRHLEGDMKAAARKSMLLHDTFVQLDREPSAEDVVKDIFGQPCEREANGAIILPLERRRPVGPSQRTTDIEIRELLQSGGAELDALFALMEIGNDVDRIRAVELIIDEVHNGPLRVLAAIYRSAPSMLGKVATIMAKIGERGWG